MTDRSPVVEAGVEHRFGPYGGQYVPETLMPALVELEAAWVAVRDDPGYRAQLAGLLRDFAGRPTPLYLAERLSELAGREIWLKREDLMHTGSHKLNNALGQALLAERMGKERIIAETGAGQHGVATATACALLGLECVVYMGAEDIRRQAPNVERMRLLGADVVSVEAGARTLKAAVSEAIRDWVTTVATTHYIIGSAVGLDAHHVGAEQFHALHVGRLAADVLGAHVDDALQSQQRAGRRAGDAVLAGAGLRDDPVLAHALGQQRLAERVVELVRAGVHEVLALEPQLATGQLREALGEVQRRRPPGEVAQQAVELAEVADVVAHPHPRRLELVERRQQRLGHVLAAIRAEAVLDAGLDLWRAVGHGSDPRRRLRAGGGACARGTRPTVSDRKRHR